MIYARMLMCLCVRRSVVNGVYGVYGVIVGGMGCGQVCMDAKRIWIARYIGGVVGLAWVWMRVGRSIGVCICVDIRVYMYVF